jgi:hypothetical protein
MKFEPETPIEAVLEKKRRFVSESRRGYYDFWSKKVMPAYLDRPLLPIGVFRLHRSQDP